jgi:hypothetical protein
MMVVRFDDKIQDQTSDKFMFGLDPVVHFRVYPITEVGYCCPFVAPLTLLEVEKMTARRKDRLGMGLLWIVHLVCCGLLVIFLVGGISIGMVTSYLLESLVPVGIVVGVIVTGWIAYHLWGKHRFKRFDNLAKSSL